MDSTSTASYSREERSRLVLNLSSDLFFLDEIREAEWRRCSSSPVIRVI